MKDNQPNENDEQQLIRQEQEEFAGVDTSIRQSVEAIRIGRDAVVERLNPNAPRTTNPVEIVNAGREQVLQSLRETTKHIGERPVHTIEQQLTELTDDVADRLHAIASRFCSGDAVGRRIIETQIRSTVTSYLASVGRILTPLQFQSGSADRNANDREEKKNENI